MKCPECEAQSLVPERIYVGGGTSTLLGWNPYYDAEGKYHSHDPNTHTQQYKCSNGHRFETKYKKQCPSCDVK